MTTETIVRELGDNRLEVTRPQRKTFVCLNPDLVKPGKLLWFDGKQVAFKIKNGLAVADSFGHVKLKPGWYLCIGEINPNEMYFGIGPSNMATLQTYKFAALMLTSHGPLAINLTNLFLEEQI